MPVLCKHPGRFSLYYCYFMTLKHQFPGSQIRVALYASQKCCEDKGLDLFHLEHMVQEDVLFHCNLTMPLTLGTGKIVDL